MLFPEEDAPLLKTWVVKRIENTSDADSDVLADYVIALLKHDGDAASVRKLCEAEIPDFLTEEPKAFLDDVFQAIAYKSYQPGAPPPPTTTTSQLSNKTGPQAAMARQVASQPDSSLPHTGSRKRAFQDHAEPEALHAAQDSAYAGGRFKQAKRGSRRGRMEDGASARQAYNNNMSGGVPMLGLPPFDPNNPMEMILRMQAMGIPLPGMPEFGAQAFSPPTGRNQPRRRGRCRDFDTKGYCSRGNTCTYDHGNDSIYVPQMTGQGEEYDPANAVLPLSHSAGLYNLHPFAADVPRSTRGGRGGHGGKKGGARAPFSAKGPVHDRTKTTIVVENIPEENFSEEEVRGFFSQFGNILEVSMQPYKHLAIVKFDTWGPANAAYRSPKVIFDNRFVKVFWYKGPEDDLPSSNVANGTRKTTSHEPNGSSEGEIVPEIDLEEFHRKQEEAQKQHQEREAKRSELESQRQELERKQQELLAKHREESERLKEKLGEKSGVDSKDQEVSATDKLRAQLAQLEQEAKILGIDPDAADDMDGVSYGGRGRGYRGRGGRGGRGAPLMRGRGSFRGQEGRHAAYAQYSIDNRPKGLSITGVDFTPSDRDEQLRHFLLNLGEFESVETSPSITYVSFQDRKTAEKFYYSLHGKEFPGVPGKLDLSWMDGTPPFTPGGLMKNPKMASSAAAAAAAAAAEDGGLATGDAMAGMDEEIEAALREEEHGRGEERQVDMDYEVASDEGWAE